MILEFYIMVTEDSVVSGIEDPFGMKLAWVFESRDRLMSFLGDFLEFIPHAKILTIFKTNTTGLSDFCQNEYFYPYTDPEIQLLMSDEDKILYGILENEFVD